MERNLDKMTFDLEQERQTVKESLHDVSRRIEKLEEGFSSLEHRVTKLEGSQTSALHLETANTGMKQRRFMFAFVLLLLINFTPKYLKTRGFYEPLPPRLEIIFGVSPVTMTGQIHFFSVSYLLWPVKCI